MRQLTGEKDWGGGDLGSTGASAANGEDTEVVVVVVRRTFGAHALADNGPITLGADEALFFVVVLLAVGKALVLEEAARERIVARFANEALESNQPHPPNHNQPTTPTHCTNTRRKERVSPMRRVATPLVWRGGREGGGVRVHSPEGAIACRGRWYNRPGWGTCTAHTWARIDRASRCGSRPCRRTPPPRARRSRQSCADRWRRPNGTAARTHGGTRHNASDSESSPSVASQQRPGNVQDAHARGNSRLEGARREETDLVPMHAERHQQFIGHGLATGAARRGDSSTQTHGTHAQRESACAGGACTTTQSRW